VGSRASDIVQGYTTLASTLLGRWNALASKSASKIDAGTYNAASAAEDVVAGAMLSTEAAGLYWVQGFNTLAAILGQEGEGNIAESEPFTAESGSRLELACRPLKGPGLTQLPMSAVSILPVQAGAAQATSKPRSAVKIQSVLQLGANESQFQVWADGSGYRGGTYVGTVNTTAPDGTTEQVPIWIIVP
jgi:hypothetical protein